MCAYFAAPCTYSFQSPKRSAWRSSLLYMEIVHLSGAVWLNVLMQSAMIPSPGETHLKIYRLCVVKYLKSCMLGTCIPKLNASEGFHLFNDFYNLTQFTFLKAYDYSTTLPKSNNATEECM